VREADEWKQNVCEEDMLFPDYILLTVPMEDFSSNHSRNNFSVFLLYKIQMTTQQSITVLLYIICL